jgi:HEAT repeat protein
MSDFSSLRINNWSTDTANDPCYVHDRAIQLVQDAKTAGENAVPMLIDALLNDPDVTVRERAASQLQRLDSPEIGDVLVQVLENRREHPFVREMVADAIRRHPTEDAYRALLGCLNDPSAEVRYWCISALGDLGEKAAIPRLRVVANYDRGEIHGYGSIAKAARRAISEIKGTLWNRSARKTRKFL